MESKVKTECLQSYRGDLAKWLGLDWPAWVMLLVSAAVVSLALMALMYRVAVLPQLKAQRIYYVFNVEQAEARMRTGHLRNHMQAMDETEQGESVAQSRAEPENFEEQWARIKEILAAFPRPVFIKGAMIEAGAGAYSIVDITEDVFETLEGNGRG